MKTNVKLLKDEKFIYRYCNIKGLFNLHYNIVIITNLRVIMIYAYKPWWYYWLFILNPNEISNTTVFIKYISSLKIKTRPIFTTSFSGPFRFLLSKELRDSSTKRSFTTNCYFPQRQSVDDILFKAFMRGLFMGSIIATILWKFFNVKIKYLLIQGVACILLNIIYDFISYKPIKYLEIFTLDGTGDNVIEGHKSRVARYKQHAYCNLYHGSKNSYIIEGDLKELSLLRDKITKAIKENIISSNKPSTENKINKKISPSTIDKELKIINNEIETIANSLNTKKSKPSTINKELKNIDNEIKAIANSLNPKKSKPSTINKELKNIDNEKHTIASTLNSKKKVRKNFLATKKKRVEFHSNLALKSKIKNSLINKAKKIKKIKEKIDENENITIIREKTLLQKFFGLVLNFLRLVLFAYLSILIPLSLMYYVTNRLKETSSIQK